MCGVKCDKKRLAATIMEKINGQTAKIGVVLDTTSNVQPSAWSVSELYYICRKT